ncbi:MAG: hypothetical protein ACREBU_01480 [Nitrososphaera sp.]
MPLFFFVAGLLAIVTAIKGNHNEVAQQLRMDFVGEGGFFWFAGGIISIYLMGTILGIPAASKLLIALVIMIYILSNPTLFEKAAKALNVRAPRETDIVKVGKATYALGEGMLSPVPIANQPGIIGSQNSTRAYPNIFDSRLSERNFPGFFPR